MAGVNALNICFSLLSSRGIEPLTVINQFFYREPPLPIGSPALMIILKELYMVNALIFNFK